MAAQAFRFKQRPNVILERQSPLRRVFFLHGACPGQRHGSTKKQKGKQPAWHCNLTRTFFGDKTPPCTAGRNLKGIYSLSNLERGKENKKSAWEAGARLAADSVYPL